MQRGSNTPHDVNIILLQIITTSAIPPLIYKPRSATVVEELRHGQPVNHKRI
jgi:hypothetical protein